MGDWDDDEWDVPDLKMPGGPGASLEPPDAWSDEEGHDAHKEEEAPVKAPAAPKAEPKEKTGLAKKIEEREAREREEAQRKQAVREQLEASAEFDGLEGEALEKARQRKMQEASDLDNAIDALGVAPRPSAAPKPGGAIEEFEPKSDKDFEALASMINDKLKTYEGKAGHIVVVKALLRGAIANVTTDEAKDLSTFVSVLYNDKVKADRDKDKKGKTKKAKGKVSVSAGKALDNDMDEWGGGGGNRLRDDDYDFM
uniref:Eukaryotic translation initiation factor 3 30 kDa subunit n=1 Tax=Calcidiscus leptoporus TaxID=127549 RepID=A0A7S0IZG2_9EUKA|eukprot:CAMPEP_0119376220 /NCGR_PEP_ID=MMETSP1334-20130426/39567_1 /TAXON_ID=127549 /ORGANISM="Calcidiscus leptoporus, Strain RCC1130" /LENGTH=254 /DNA_ID=CAMNT_0007394745 /DNA_START=53 /DNA_END=817 /DNA_ORIENTATION=-